MSASSRPSYCYARLPRTGLGNMFFVWARALVFARLNELPLIVSGWGQIRIGPLLRGELKKRLYFGYFSDPAAVGLLKKPFIWHTYRRLTEPEVRVLPAQDRRQGGRLYVFEQIPHWSDYYKDFREYRDEVRAALFGMLAPKQRRALEALAAPVIGVHVRRGDFRELRPGEDFRKVGLTRTPLSYFRSLIQAARELHGTALPVTLFSDGYDEELRDLLALPAVHRAPATSDIVALLLLAQSKLIIASAGSSFSDWAIFFSEAPAIRHREHIHAPIRPHAITERVFEGGVPERATCWPALLKQNMGAI